MHSSILVAVDLDEPTSGVKSVPTALALGRCFGAGLSFVYVVPSMALTLQAQWSEPGVRHVLDSARTRLAALADELAGGIEGECYVAEGSVYAGILEAAEQLGADLIVLSSHRPEMKDYLIGADASRVVRHARCSVMVVRD